MPSIIPSYNQVAELPIGSACFSYARGTFDGTGLLHIDQGPRYHIQLLNLKRRGGDPFEREVAFGGSPGPIPSNYYCTIRMRLWSGLTAVAQHMALTASEDFDIVLERRLTVEADALVFSVRSPDETIRGWRAQALLARAPGTIVWPRPLEQITKIDGQPYERSQTRSALWYEGDGQRIIGRELDDGNIELHWRAEGSTWARSKAWRCALAAENALSILLDREVQVVEQHLWGPAGERAALYLPRDLRRSLGLAVSNHGRLQESELLQLTTFLLGDTPEVRACQGVLYQMGDAARQRSWRARELLIATILEGVLRTLGRQPVRTTAKYDVCAQLHVFRKKYLSKAWTDRCDEVAKAATRLRDRNAHLDWLPGSNPVSSDEGFRAAFDDMALVSRFYGTIIRALAGLPVGDPA